MFQTYQYKISYHATGNTYIINVWANDSNIALQAAIAAYDCDGCNINETPTITSKRFIGEIDCS